MYDAVHRFYGIFVASECGETEEMLSVRAESRARCAYDIDFGKQTVKILPAGESVRRLQPDIRRIDTAVNGVARILQTVIDRSGIFLVIADLLSDLLLPSFV